MKNKKAIFCTSLFLFLTQIVYANEAFQRDKTMEATLLAMERKAPQEPTSNLRSAEIETQENNLGREAKKNITYSINDLYFTFGLQVGYLQGNTAYDFNHHTSELEFPMDNVMGGSNFTLGYKDLSLNAEIWTALEDDAGYEMKDKDWVNGILASYTKSKASMDALIWDANLRYNFYKKEVDPKSIPTGELKFDKIKVGALLGYKYERFDFDMYDLRNQLTGTATNQGQRVLTYNIKYYLPYLGAAADLQRKGWGIGLNIKYSFYPIARDEDNHLLRYLTFYGDYEKDGQAWMGNIYGFWEFMKNWQLKAGANWTLIRIDGITWDATHDPAWDAEQSTDTVQKIFWSGIEYRF